MFALGFFVVISSIIRAYYSKLNETMLTCTVSMIETAVAIIATCLPALRTLILGHISRVDTTYVSTGRHYELSSRKPGNGTQREAHDLKTTRNGHDSEDELVKEGASVSSTGIITNGAQSSHGITVSTEFQVVEVTDNDDDRKRRVRHDV